VQLRWELTLSIEFPLARPSRPERHERKKLMVQLQRYAVPAARSLLGLTFVVIGINFFLHFLPQPPIAAAPLAFLSALLASGFIMPLIKTIEVVAGLMLLSNRFVPLALTLLAPIIVAIVGYHLSLAPEGTPIALLVLVLELALAWAYRRAFAPMLQAKVKPEPVGRPAPAERALRHA
jgi:hypothetical protein